MIGYFLAVTNSDYYKIMVHEDITKYETEIILFCNFVSLLTYEQKRLFKMNNDICSCTYATRSL